MADLAGHVVVVDLNRQSLDRVVGDHRSRQIERLFQALGWHVVVAALRRPPRARSSPSGAVSWLAAGSRPWGTSSTTRSCGSRRRRRGRRSGRARPPETVARLEALGDAEVAALLTDLGGHDLDAIVDAFARGGGGGRPSGGDPGVDSQRAGACPSPATRSTTGPSSPVTSWRRSGATSASRRATSGPRSRPAVPRSRYVRRVMGEGIGLPRRFRRPPPGPFPTGSTCRPGRPRPRRRPSATFWPPSAVSRVSTRRWSRCPPTCRRPRTCPGG